MESGKLPESSQTDQPNRQPRAGWAEQLRAMAEAGDDKLLDEPTPTKFDDEEWEWEDQE